MERRSAKMEIETETTDIGASIIADIEAEIVTMADTRGAGARTLGRAAPADEIIHKIESSSTHQVVEGMILGSVRAEAIDMIHIGGGPQHILALTESVGVMMLSKIAGEQRSKLGNWLPCNRLRPSLTMIERSV